MDRPFHNVYSHGFVRAAVCIPSVRVADPAYNAERTLGLARRAHELHAAVALFPELGISAYSNDDLFHQSALLDGTVQALARVVRESVGLMPVLLVGAPLLFEGKLFNCAVVIHRGRVLGIVPKSYLPNYREFYEKRQFTSGRMAVAREVGFLGQAVPFGADLAFDAVNVDGFRLAVEICEDVWVPIPPSTWTALAGGAGGANPSPRHHPPGEGGGRPGPRAPPSGE